MGKFIEILYTDDTRTLLRKDSIIRVQETQNQGTWIIYKSETEKFIEMYSATSFDDIREKLNG